MMSSTTKRIVVGIASFGMSGKVFHAPLLSHHRGYRIKRIVQRTGDDAQALYPGVHVSRSFDDLLHDPEIELLIVNTPDQSHHELAKKALEAGKHVVVEKPFTQTVTQGEELIRLARSRGKVLTVFQNRRWDGDFLTVQHIVREKMLGRLVDFESHYDRYRNFIQLDTWKERAAVGAGLLYNLGSHMIDQVLVLFGKPEAITAHVRTIRAGGEVEDWYDIRFHYPDVNVSTRSSYLVREAGPRYILHGTNGSFVKYGLDTQEEALKQGEDPHQPGWGREGEEWWGVLNTEFDGISSRRKLETQPGNYRAFYDGLYECLVGGVKPPVKPAESLEVIRIIEAAKKSSEQRTTVAL